MSTQALSAQDALAAGRQVLDAARDLRDALDAEPARRDYAVERLQSVARGRLDTSRAAEYGYENPGTAEPDEGQAAPPAPVEVPLADTLASALTNLHTANVLIAAGQSLGETGTPAPRQKLDEAILGLDTALASVERSSDGSGTDSGAVELGFMDDVAALQRIESEDLDGAIDNLKERQRVVLAALASGSREVVGKTIDRLSKLPLGDVLEAVGHFGAGLADLPKVGTLISQGMEMLEGVRQALVRLVNTDVFTAVKEQVKQLLESARDGKAIDTVFEWVLGKPATDKLLAEVLKSPRLGGPGLDVASNDLGQLAMNFRHDMQLASALLAAVSVAGTLLGWVPGAGTAATLVALGLDALILVGVILIAMDYADAQPVLCRVRGVRAILNGVRA